MVHPETDVLYLIEGGVQSNEPGCYPEDAAEFLSYADSFGPGAQEQDVFVATPSHRRRPPPPPQAQVSGGPAEKDTEPDSPTDEAGPSGTVREAELLEMKHAERVALAQSLSVSGYSRMKRDELIGAIINAEMALIGEG